MVASSQAADATPRQAFEVPSYRSAWSALDWSRGGNAELSRGAEELIQKSPSPDSSEDCSGSEDEDFDDAERSLRRRRLAWIVVALAVLATCVGLPQVPTLLHFHSPLGYEAGANSPAVLALEQLKNRFPAFAEGMSSPVVMMIRATSSADTVLTGAVANFSKSLCAAVKADDRVTALAPVCVSYHTGVSLGGMTVPELFLRGYLVSRDRRATLLVLIATRAPKMAVFRRDGKNKVAYAPWLYRKMFMEFLKEFTVEPPAGTEVLLSGNPVVAYERVFDHSVERLTTAEVFVLPLAALVFAWLVGGLRLLLLPPVVLLVSFSVAATMAVPLAKWSPLSPDVPAAMVSVLLACSLDYSLFLLTRFNENRQRGYGLEQNVSIVVRQTGKTITVSGLLIAIAFFGATLVPERNLRNAGRVLGLSVLAGMVVNVTLMPALLLLAGNVLTDSGPVVPLWRSRETSRNRRSPESVERSSRPDQGFRNELDPGATTGKPVVDSCSQSWYTLIRHIEHCPLLAMLVVFVIFLPVMVQLPSLQITADAYAMLPRDMPSVVAVRELAKQFPVGRSDPYTIVLVTDKATPDSSQSKEGSQLQSLGNALLTREGFTSMLQLCDSVKKLGGVDSILGPPMIMTQRVDWPKALAWHSPKTTANLHKLYMGILQTHVNGSAVLLQLHTKFLPRGPGAADWVLRVRRVLALWEQAYPGCSATLSGAATLATDARDTAMGAMPVYLGVSTTLIMAVVLAMFHSLLLPLRLALALCFTLAATFGMAILVYQTPLLHWVWPWLADYHGITYEVVPMAACVAVALGLDYDIFLVSRIMEYRLEGFSDQASITQGVTCTGGIISGAGTIMALAFSGLFFAEKMMLQQLAFLLATSVLLDTFVVRTVLVPALMLSAGDMNWWPRKMPRPRGMEEFISSPSSEDDETQSHEQGPGQAQPIPRTDVAWWTREESGHTRVLKGL